MRELENSIEHAVVLAKSQLIEVADLPSGIHKASSTAGESCAGHPKTIVQNEKRLLQEVLVECGWNKKLAAKRLGISRSTCMTRSGSMRSPSPPSIDSRPGSHGIPSHAGFLSRSRIIYW